MVFEILQSICGWVFAVAGLSKLSSAYQFRLTLLQLPYLPYQFVGVLSRMFPLLEVGVGFGLMLNIFAAKIAAFVLVFCFYAVSVVAILKKLEIACNCFGDLGRSKLGLTTIYRNTVLFALLILVFFGIDEITHPIHASIVAGTLLLVVLASSQLKANADTIAYTGPVMD